MRGCFSRAVEWGRCPSSPVANVKPYRVDNVRTRVLSRDETHRLLNDEPGDLALLARATLEGLFRLSEMLNLRVEDIKEDHVTLVYTKNNRVRKVPITQSLKEALLARAHSSGFVFGRNTDGMPTRVEIVSVQFCRLAKRLGLAGVSHHTLRHTAATAMLESGVSLRAVQEIGGWTSLRMLERYAHPSDAEKRRAVELMAARTAPGTKTGTEPSRADSPKNHGASKLLKRKGIGWRPQRDSNPCLSLERAISWASGRWGRGGRLRHRCRDTGRLSDARPTLQYR